MHLNECACEGHLRTHHILRSIPASVARLDKTTGYEVEHATFNARRAQYATEEGDALPNDVLAGVNADVTSYRSIVWRAHRTNYGEHMHIGITRPSRAVAAACQELVMLPRHASVKVQLLNAPGRHQPQL